MYSSGGFGQDLHVSIPLLQAVRVVPDRFAVAQKVSINNAYAVCMPDSIDFTNADLRQILRLRIFSRCIGEISRLFNRILYQNPTAERHTLYYLKVFQCRKTVWSRQAASSGCLIKTSCRKRIARSPPRHHRTKQRR